MAKEIKIPKRIAGIKIPKSIRKGPIADFVCSSGGQVLLAEAVLALGAFYAARRFDATTPTGELLRHPIDRLRTTLAGTSLGDNAIASASDRLGRACRAAVQAFRTELAGSASDVGTPAEQGDADSVSAEADTEVAKKKSRRSRAESSRPETTSGPH